MKTGLGWGAAIAASGVLAAACGAARAQDAAGDWHGSLSVPNGPTLRVGLTIRSDKVGGGYEGMIASPDQSPDAMPLDTAKVENGTLTFSVSAIMGSYSGKWDAGRKAWVGEWTQVGASMPLVLTAGKP
jgi:hypothetical protein